MTDQELQTQIEQQVNSAMAPFTEKLEKLLGTAKSEDSAKQLTFEARMTKAVENYKTSGENLKGKEI